MTLAVAAWRGPSGVAPGPPAWLSAAALPLDLVPAGTVFFRIHRVAHGPIFFGPGRGVPPTYRFDSPTGRFGVLYVGLGLAGAMVETLLRNPGRRIVAYPELAARASCALTSTRDLRVVRLHGTGLQAVGCDNAISTGPYEPCGVWADALWDHKERPDGIAYQSRHDSAQICLALFERADIGLEASDPVPLARQLPAVATILGGYGKSIVDVPA